MTIRSWNNGDILYSVLNVYLTFKLRMGLQLSWLERTPDKREVDGSSPFRPTIKLNYPLRGLSSDGRAPALHAGGQRFDPASLHHYYFTTIYGKQLSLVEHLVWDQGVAGSNPVFPTLIKRIWGLSSDGRAPALHAGGQRFDPASLHHIYLNEH